MAARANEQLAWRRDSTPSNAVGPYSARLTTLYVLLVTARLPERSCDTWANISHASLFFVSVLSQLADAAINSTADATYQLLTRTDTILVLVLQLFVRVSCFLTLIGMLASSRRWRDEFIVQYCGVFSVSLIGLIVCLFLRVYRVTLASYPSRFPTVLSYWSAYEYSSLMLGHTLLSLLFYYYSIMSAFRIGSSRMDGMGELDKSCSTPSVYAALQEANKRRIS